MIKKINSNIKLQIAAQKANPGPPIGPLLGQKGINIVDFCNRFNKETNKIEEGLLITVIITIYDDKTFIFNLKSTPTSILIKKEINVKLGSSDSKKIIIGNLSKDQIIKIAKLKSKDIFSNNIDSICKSIIGTAKSMGVKVNY